MPELPKIYIAGPGVFRPDADELARELKDICHRYWLEGLWPADGPSDTARLIAQANLKMIRSAAALVADVSPFRGPHSDDGTAYEIGFAHALGKPTFAWSSNTEPLAWRIEGKRIDGILRDSDGYAIEDFAAPVNLMLAHAVQSISASAEEAIAAAARHLGTHLRPV